MAAKYWASLSSLARIGIMAGVIGTLDLYRGILMTGVVPSSAITHEFLVVLVGPGVLLLFTSAVCAMVCAQTNGGCTS